MGRFHAWRVATAVAVGSTLALVTPTIAQAVPADMSGAIAQVEPAVARLDTTNDYQHVIGTGTGIVLDPGGLVLTNFHVVQGADTITATVGGQPFTADLLGYDRSHDVALLGLRGAGGLPIAPLGDSGSLSEGEPVVALGNAGGTGGPLTREAGEVVGFGRTITANDELTGSSDELTGLIEFAAPVRAGDSGGPVVNAAGQVVGVTVAATVNFRMGPGGAGFAIPVNQALAIASQIRSQVPTDSVHIGRPTLLGVGVSAREQQSDLPGVLIHEVLIGGPAHQAGVHDGDVLLSIDGVQLGSPTALTNVLDVHYPGDVVDLVWIDRAGEQRTGKAPLAS